MLVQSNIEGTTNPQTLKNQEHEKAVQRSSNLSQVEGNMLKLNQEKDKFKDELSKIPTHAKTGAQIRRREHLEKEIGSVCRSIGTLKQKLREMEAI